MSDQTRSSANTEPQQLLDSGPMLLRDFNPKAVLHFTGRKCATCGNEIMDHWLKPSRVPELQGLYWCQREGGQTSGGITDGRWDVPEGFSKDNGSDKE